MFHEQPLFPTQQYTRKIIVYSVDVFLTWILTLDAIFYTVNPLFCFIY